MKKSYWKICKAQGISDEEIKAIQKACDTGRDRMKYINRIAEEMQISFISLDNDETNFEIEDISQNIEKTIFIQEEMRLVNKCVNVLKVEERKLLRAYFELRENAAAVGRKYDMTAKQAEREIKRLLAIVRKEYFRLNPDQSTEYFRY